MEIYNLISFGGIFAFPLIAWAISENRKILNWRVISYGITLQILVAIFIFVVPAGSKFFLFLNDIIVQILNSASAGSEFVFGRLALSPGQSNALGEQSIGFILAFQGFPTIIFFSALISVLYFLNIMPKIIKAFSYVFTKLMKISGAESLVAASNIFVGIESAFTVKPHLKDMTRSEFCTVLSVGMATVASNILALYVFTLKSQFPTIAAHLISASLLSAPAALVISKIILPETETPKTLGKHIEPYHEKENSLFESIMNGANSGIKMIVGIVALLIAVLSLTALLDLGLSLIGSKINTLANMQFEWSLKNIFGYIFYPFTLIIGVPLSDAGVISKIIGERIIVTEVVAYQDLAKAISQGAIQHTRSYVIATYALCGFAHLASMSIFVGGVSALAPEKTKIISSVAFKALISATLACLMTAAVAGAFFTKNSILFG
ncbi:MAG: nucleoside transporter C-terminal domain-containing protein [Candidatus Zapsychrus exili]|nr:nucleoside transporter C-terminal domain-containing protein [Candidatus Zapsychrus exili]